MSNTLCVEKSRPSSVIRLPFLPRIGVVVDIAGRRISYRQAPLLEALINLRRRGFSFRNFLDVSIRQLEEISFPEKVDLGAIAEARRQGKKAAQRARGKRSRR